MFVEIFCYFDCCLDFDAFERSIGLNTRAVLFNMPNNPSGVVWSREEVERLTALAVAHDLTLVSDEICCEFIYDGARNTSPVEAHPRGAEVTAIIDGASKAFAMTGYRIGYVAGPRPLIDAVVRLNSQMTGAPNTVSQAAYKAAIEAPPQALDNMRATFAERRQFLVTELRAMGFSVPEPRGAFYCFPNVSSVLRGRSSVQFCEQLLEAEALALIPGSAFGLDAHVRFSYATDLDNIKETLVRFRRFVS